MLDGPSKIDSVYCSTWEGREAGRKLVRLSMLTARLAGRKYTWHSFMRDTIIALFYLEGQGLDIMMSLEEL